MIIPCYKLERDNLMRLNPMRLMRAAVNMMLRILLGFSAWMVSVVGDEECPLSPLALRPGVCRPGILHSTEMPSQALNVQYL